MTAWLSVILLGFFLGMRHATDPDHVIAVSTIVSRQRTILGAAVVGILWGIGHTVTIVLVGTAIILFGLVIPPRVGLSLEFSVALMLVALGLANLAGLRKWVRDALSSGWGSDEKLHSHPHSHGDYVHSHPHGHGEKPHGHGDEDTPQGWLDRMFGRRSVYQFVRPVVVGVIHGLAGSAAVALLVLATIRDPVWALAYLLVFGLGTIAGMVVITAAIAVPFAYAPGRVTQRLAAVSGIVSVALGVFLAYRIGFVEGLFIGSPWWTPE